MALRPDEQWRWIVAPPVVTGRPASRPGEAGEVAGAVGAVAEVDVLDGFGLDARLGDRVADGVRRHASSPA